MKKYNQLNFEQRYLIESLLKKRQTKEFIASALGVNETTIYRELKRNGKPRSYNAKHAQMLADERKEFKHLKKHITINMERIICEKLTKQQWSPDEIKGWCDEHGIDMVSHESIYQYVWKDKAQGGSLYKHLRNANKKYKKRYGSKNNRGKIPDKVSIEKRPERVDKKQEIGDFEVDLVEGKGHKGALLTMVDRYSGLLLVENVKGKKADIVASKMINALAPFKTWIKTITNDNGKEFTQHKKISRKLQCNVYFAHPYSSWERGLNENTNKLLRQYFPKNQPLDNVKQKTILDAVKKLNNRPRKRFNYKTPMEMFYQYIYRNKPPCT